ncbi:MAG: DUF87 domain-containing protein [Candidatus Micrarchaeales archaeon]|jgi:hypothetical protein
MELNLAEGINLDMQTIMTGRGCAIGQSGSGKSFLAGVIAEELGKAGMPFCVVDTEGEYASLRNLFNIIIVGGDKKDVGLDVDFSRLFDASISNDLPIILDVSDAVDKKEAVYDALQALYQLESKIHKPYLLIIEEADKFAPQVVGKGTNMIEEISIRGRKRGIGIFITTQRPANISKNVLAQCSYGFIGKLTIENDLNAIRILFGNRSRLTQITRLHTGEFLPFGLDYEMQFRVKSRSARHMGATPSIESYRPSSSALITVLKELKGDTSLKKRPGESSTSRIQAIPLQFSFEDAKSYAERISRKKFVFFGNTDERIDSIMLQYLPLGLCVIRIPTRRRNEYDEYACLLNSRYELTLINKGIKFLAVSKNERNRTNHKKYALKKFPQFNQVETSKESIIDGNINKKRAATCISRIFPNSIMTSFQIVHSPVYRITLRKKNKVRVFTIDGIYGRNITA